jgi:hypothetical protein
MGELHHGGEQALAGVAGDDFAAARQFFSRSASGKGNGKKPNLVFSVGSHLVTSEALLQCFRETPAGRTSVLRGE